MRIATTRFGEIEVDEGKLLHFAEGLLGFPRYKRFALVQTSQDPVFYWMQSVDAPNLAFIVCDPRTFVADYVAPVRREDLRGLDLQNLDDDAQVLIIVNKVDGILSGNLLGPLVLNQRTLAGKQVVLADKRYSTRHPLVQLAALAGDRQAVRTA